MSRLRLVLAAPLALLSTALLIVGLAGPASAHVSKNLGPYTITTGWQTEPTYVGSQNAVQLFVHDAQGNAVDDIGDGLKVIVSYGNQKTDQLDLMPSFDPDTNLGNHGEFDAAIIPTQPGNYTFHFVGNIKGLPVDQSFTSSDQTFDVVKAPSSIQFPTQAPTASQLAASVNHANSRINSASSSSDTALALGIAALAVAVLLGGTGLALGLTARRRAVG